MSKVSESERDQCSIYRAAEINATDIAQINQLRRMCRLICDYDFVPHTSSKTIDLSISILERIKKVVAEIEKKKH